MALIIEDKSIRPHRIDANSDQPRCNAGWYWEWSVATTYLRIIIEDDTITVIAGGRSPGGRMH